MAISKLEREIRKKQIKNRITEVIEWGVDKIFELQDANNLSLCLEDKDKGIWSVYGPVPKKRRKKLKQGTVAECLDFMLEWHYREKFTGFNHK